MGIHAEVQECTKVALELIDARSSFQPLGFSLPNSILCTSFIKKKGSFWCSSCLDFLSKVYPIGVAKRTKEVGLFWLMQGRISAKVILHLKLIVRPILFHAQFPIGEGTSKESPLRRILHPNRIWRHYKSWAQRMLVGGKVWPQGILVPIGVLSLPCLDQFWPTSRTCKGEFHVWN